MIFQTVIVFSTGKIMSNSYQETHPHVMDFCILVIIFRGESETEFVPS